MRSVKATLLLLIGIAPGPAVSGAADRAHFRVLDRVVAEDPGPFSATIGGIGNGAEMIRDGSGFEPVIFRNWFLATEGAPDRVIADPTDITVWDQIGNGALDGADVRVYRIENGAFRLVRRDRIPEGGFHASGWIRETPQGRVIPTRTTQFLHSFEAWNRPNAEYWYTVRAVDGWGRLSPPAKPVKITSPANFPKQKPKRRRLIAFEERRGRASGKLPAAPGNLRAKIQDRGHVALSWQAVPGVAGYALFRSDGPPDRHKGFGFDLAEGRDEAAIRKGDLVLVSKKMTEFSRPELLSNRVWNARGPAKMFLPRTVKDWPDGSPGTSWRLASHDRRSPVEEAGETYLEVTMARRGKIRVGTGTNSGTAQQFYPVLEPGVDYRAEVWMKANRGMTVTFDFGGFHGQGPRPIPKESFRIGPEWRKYTYTFRPKVLDPTKKPGQMWLIAGGPGVLGIDNFRVYRADTPYLDLVPEDYARLARSGIGVLRTHATVKTRQRTYDLAQLTNPGGLPTGIENQNSLPQMLSIMEKAGVDPWLQIEPHFTPAEWQGLIEYLAAPYDPGRDSPASKPWAAKRYAQGRRAPWTDAFGKIYFELANETWNDNFGPWVFQNMRDAGTGDRVDRATAYGLFQAYVSGEMRKSPYWNRIADKWVTVVGGWEGRDYGDLAARAAPETDIVTIAAYLGGWEARQRAPEETPAGYFSLMTHALQRGLPTARLHRKQAREVSEARGRPVSLGTYEAGPGYVLPGLGGLKVTREQLIAQEKIMKSLAAGTATLDAFLLRARAGFTLQNFFTWGPGPTWRSHAHDHRGGQDYPMWQLLSLYNREATGDFLKVEIERVPHADLAEAPRRVAIKNAPLVVAYATRQDDRVAVFLLSRRIPGMPDGGDGVTEVTLDLPFTRADRVRRFRTTGHYNQNNLQAENIKIEERVLERTSGLDRFNAGKLAPGSTQLFVFEGVR